MNVHNRIRRILLGEEEKQMPGPYDSILENTSTAPVRVRLEPAFTAVQNLLLLAKEEAVPDLGEWMIQTSLAMTPEERRTNELVAIGFYHAIAPERSWPSFQAYLRHLEQMDAEALRNKMLDTYQALVSLSEEARNIDGLDIYQSLGSLNDYLDFLLRTFGASHTDKEIETRAYAYVVDPPAMKEVILAHLRNMWEKYLFPDWKQVLPVLQEVVSAYEETDFSQMDRYEAIHLITGIQVDEDRWKHMVDKVRQIIFVPTPHMGPYLGRYHSSDTLWILFQARLPKGAEILDTDLSRAEILVRLSALADDTRLKLLKYIAAHGEAHSQELIETFKLSQSAASRQLMTLTGMGYLSERRCDGAKCYSLNPERIDETLRALSQFLLGR